MMTVDQVEVLGPDGEVIGQLAGEELASNIVLVGSQESVGPAGTFFIFMDHQLPAGDDGARVHLAPVHVHADAGRRRTDGRDGCSWVRRGRRP